MTTTTYRTNDLFRAGLIPEMNACVGENGGPYDISAYAWGFWEAAEATIRAAGDHEAPIDVLIYPIVYCYRHAVELSVKHLARELPKLYSGTDAVVIGHKLADMWRDVTGYLARDAAFDPDGTLVPLVDKALTDLMEFDPMGFVFRYPESLKGDLHLQDSWLINIHVLRDAMQPVREAFKHWEITARAIEESRAQ